MTRRNVAVGLVVLFAFSAFFGTVVTPQIVKARLTQQANAHHETLRGPHTLIIRRCGAFPQGAYLTTGVADDLVLEPGESDASFIDCAQEVLGVFTNGEQ